MHHLSKQRGDNAEMLCMHVSPDNGFQMHMTEDGSPIDAIASSDDSRSVCFLSVLPLLPLCSRLSCTADFLGTPRVRWK